MWPPWKNIAVLIHYTYSLPYIFLVSRWLHISYCLHILFVGFKPLCVTHKPKYSILVWPNNELSILHLSHFSFSLFKTNYRFCTWSVQCPFVNTKRSSMYTQINSNPLNKSFVLCWKMSRELSIPIVRRLYQYFPHRIIIVHKLIAFLLSPIW